MARKTHEVPARRLGQLLAMPALQLLVCVDRTRVRLLWILGEPGMIERWRAWDCSPSGERAGDWFIILVCVLALGLLAAGVIG